MLGTIVSATGCPIEMIQRLCNSPREVPITRLVRRSCRPSETHLKTFRLFIWHDGGHANKPCATTQQIAATTACQHIKNIPKKNMSISNADAHITHIPAVVAHRTRQQRSSNNSSSSERSFTSRSRKFC